MINLKNFLKTVTVFSLMVTIVPDAKPMGGLFNAAYEFMWPTPEFSASELTTLFTAQDYTALRPRVETYLAGAQNDAVFDLIQKVRTNTNDQYALYMDIFNFVDKRRKKSAVGPGEISCVLTSMVFQMLQLPGEIACCLARGDVPEERMAVYELFRTTYAYWFKTYLCQNQKLFNSQKAYTYSIILAEGVGGYKKFWDDKQVVAPHAVWVRHCTADLNEKHRIHFNTASEAEHTGFKSDENIRLDARMRRDCWKEAVEVAATCDSWEAFFDLKLGDLIPKELTKLVRVNNMDGKTPGRRGVKNDQDGVDGVTNGVKKLSLQGSGGQSQAGKPGSGDPQAASNGSTATAPGSQGQPGGDNKEAAKDGKKAEGAQGDGQPAAASDQGDKKE